MPDGVTLSTPGAAAFRADCMQRYITVFLTKKVCFFMNRLVTLMSDHMIADSSLFMDRRNARI